MNALKKWLPFKKEDAKLPIKRMGSPGAQNHPLVQMQHEIDRLFDRFWTEPFAGLTGPDFGSLDRWYGDFAPSRFAPSIDIANEKKHLRITAELPGMDEKDVKLTLQDGVLSIRGEKKETRESEEDGYYRTERSYGAFERTVPLPVEVDADKAEATFKKGVLTVRIPKTASETAAKAIPVRSAP